MLLQQHYLTFLFHSPRHKHFFLHLHPSLVNPPITILFTTLFIKMSATPSYLASLVGSNVTIPAYSTNLVAIPARTWKIISKVDQDVVMRDHNDIADGLSAAHVAVKFRCVSVGSREPPQQALMRIYKQLPIAGTELDDLETRSTQAAKTFDCPEAQALYNMKRQNCKVVPELLGLQVTRQPEHDWVPGGILIYVVWEHVAGDSLDFDEFWRLPFVKRQAIRAKFAETFRLVLIRSCFY
jgi:hypothetical protein